MIPSSFVSIKERLELSTELAVLIWKLFTEIFTSPTIHKQSDLKILDQHQEDLHKIVDCINIKKDELSEIIQECKTVLEQFLKIKQVEQFLP